MMKRWKHVRGSFFLGLTFGVLIAGSGALRPVGAAAQHFFFNSVRVGDGLGPATDFFGTGDLLASRRTFTSELVAGALAKPGDDPTPGNIRVRDETGQTHVRLAASEQGGMMTVNATNGVTTVQIIGGTSSGRIILNGQALDLAETFPFGEDTPTPGDVVVIDPDNPGQLRRSWRAYDRAVVGVVAGANGLNSGIVLGGNADPSHQPVALIGRIYCWVDAAYGSVQPGDLLTTSPTPGHAMLVQDMTKAQGAILGKALQPLQSGRGKILVLVRAL